MVKNYYKILSVPTTASLSQIQEGYKRAVLKWHPNKTKIPIEQASKEFAEASEAYEVLSTPTLRAVFDAYGYSTLMSGIMEDKQIIFQAYEFKSTPQEIYKRFILEANPFIGILTQFKSPGSMFSSGALGKDWENIEKPLDVEVSVLCTLEELYFGCVKSVKFSKSLMNSTRNTTYETVFCKEVIIKPGYSNGVQLVYPGEGSEKMNCRTGNLIVKISEKEHGKFIRVNDDLHVTVSIGLHEALSASSVEFEHLDKTIKVVSVDYCISPQHQVVLNGLGMPVLDSNRKGSLYVHFDIMFPERIPEEKLEDLRALLPS